MSVAIVDYGSGNLHSAAKAFERAARESGHDQPILVTRNPDDVRRAERIVLPGVGAFADCRHGLDAVPGMVEALEETVRGKGRPFLGICVGMQMLFDASEECPGAVGLGVVAGTVCWLPEGVKRPQMQWNVLEPTRAGSLFASVDDRPWAYFLHSFHAVPDDAGVVAATCDYGGPVVAAVERGNVAAVQFHPEKSGAAGLALLARWTATIGVRA